jgi:hypothetical protein
MMTSVKRNIPAGLRTSPLKLPIKLPPIIETERPENVSHLQGNWRLENSGVYLHMNIDNGVVRNRLMRSSKTKKILSDLIIFFLISKKENIRNVTSNITIP